MILLPSLALAALAGQAGQQSRTVAAKTEIVEQQGAPGAVKRAAIQPVEKGFDARLEMTNPPDPFDVLGNSRAVYLPGFGLVLTAEVDLIKVPGLSPFHQKITDEERPRLHARKLAALPRLKEAMKAELLAAAAELRTVPLNEKIVIGVNLFYFVGEDASNLPAQVVAQATRAQLLTKAGADLIQFQEF